MAFQGFQRMVARKAGMHHLVRASLAEFIRELAFQDRFDVGFRQFSVGADTV